MRKAILFAVFAAPGLFSQSQSDGGMTPELMEKVRKQESIYRNWSAQSTQGAELRAERIETVDAPGVGKLAHFRLFVTGVPRDLPYHLIVARINGSTMPSPPDPKMLEESGLVADSPGDPHDLFTQAAKGEPYLFALVSDDKNYKAFASVIPFPIKSEDKGCSIEVVRLMTDFEQALIRLSGFPPESKVHMDTESAGEKHSGDSATDKSGKADVSVLPYKKDTKKGDFVLKAVSSNCSPTVKFQWGKNTYKTE